MVIKLLRIIMIDGSYPSQLPELQAMRSSHYKNLQKIVNKSAQHISWMPSDFIKMSLRKKSNHVSFDVILGKLEKLPPQLYLLFNLE